MRRFFFGYNNPGRCPGLQTYQSYGLYFSAIQPAPGFAGEDPPGEAGVPVRQIKYVCGAYSGFALILALCVGLSTGSAKYNLTGYSSREIGRQGQIGFFARGGFFCFVFFP